MNSPMPIKISKKIKSYSVIKPEDVAAAAAAAAAPAPSFPEGTQAAIPFSGAEVIQMHEKIERP